MKQGTRERKDGWLAAGRVVSLWGWLALVLAMVAAGCRQTAPVVADVDPVGVYTLLSIDGKAVPCEVAHEGTPVPVKAGVFTIRADGTCASQMSLVAPGGREVTITRGATYTRQGPTLTMQWEGFGTTTGTLAGDTFSMDNEGSVYSYRR